jgi:hypothetical protein
VDQSLITVESDKASMEIPSSQAGVVKEVKVKVGDKVAKARCCCWWKPLVKLLPHRLLLQHLHRLQRLPRQPLPLLRLPLPASAAALTCSAT